MSTLFSRPFSFPNEKCCTKPVIVASVYVLFIQAYYIHITIQDFNTIVSSEISLEMEALNVCKDSFISMETETFDRLSPGLNSFHRELLLIGSPHKR